MIVARATDERIVAAVPPQWVVACPAVEMIRFAYFRRLAGKIAVGPVVTIAADDFVGAAQTVHDIVAHTSVEHVVAMPLPRQFDRIADQQIRPDAAVDPICPAAAEESDRRRSRRR